MGFFFSYDGLQLPLVKWWWRWLWLVSIGFCGGCFFSFFFNELFTLF